MARKEPDSIEVNEKEDVAVLVVVGLGSRYRANLRKLCDKSCRVLWRMLVKRCLIILQIN